MCFNIEPLLDEIEDMLSLCSRSKGGCDCCAYEKQCLQWYNRTLNYLCEVYPYEKNGFKPDSDILFIKLYAEWSRLTKVTTGAALDKVYKPLPKPTEPLHATPTASRR